MDDPLFQKGRRRRDGGAAERPAQPRHESDRELFAGGRILYVHGVGNQTAPSVLKRHWDMALFGSELGERSRIGYWVNRHYYPTPIPSSVADSATLWHSAPPVTDPRIHSLSDETFDRIIDDLSPSPEADRALRAIGHEWLRKFQRTKAAGNTSAADPLIQLSASLLLRDLDHYLFNSAERDRILEAVSCRLQPELPFVVVAHGLGALVAYEALLAGDPQRLDVRLFVTIGAPFGFSQIVKALEDRSQQTMRQPACVDQWLNVYAEGDLLGGPLPGKVAKNESLAEQTHHGVTSYLASNAIRSAVVDKVGNDFGQATGAFLVAKDVARNLEDFPDDRHHVLLRLADVSSAGGLAENRAKLLEALDRILLVTRREARVQQLKRYVAAELTRREIEELSLVFQDLPISHIWRDAEKSSLIHQSTHTIQAHAARIGYAATGRGICWAVLDTGVQASHQHFRKFGNIEGQWDCTQYDELPGLVGSDASRAIDTHGHGTHVAAILAGESAEPQLLTEDGEQFEAHFAGIAPECRVRSYAVLKPDGRGRDSWIIKALDHIAETNEAAGRLAIHGINLSLGGHFDASVYGCGHSPLCEELRRLWNQGVLVCIAAGNEGMSELQTSRGLIRANLDMSLMDPANLEEAIVVGSVHKSKPHTYGVSYFSSCGPTADGRIKPDVVAPGEGILSANAHARDRQARDLYIARSGTSMATPHVSGVLAAFLSLRREFIGRPDEVKRILLDNCTCLQRDSYFQGRGLPNLIKMLAQT